METPRALKRRRRFAAAWRRTARWGSILGLLLLAACAPAMGSPTPTPWRPPTAVPSATPTVTPVPSPSPTPTLTPTPTPLACWHQGGTLRSVSLETSDLPHPLPVIVYLPPCYDQLPQARYPVLYLFHGQNFDEHQWVRLGVPQTADRLIAAGEAPPFIVVMPGEDTWTQPADTGFDEAVLHTLMPWVEAHFHTRNERQYRAVGGLSRGASWAIHFGLSQWQLFGSIGGHSPPIFWEDVGYIRPWLEAIPEGEWPRIYLDIGRGDQQQILSSAQWFEQILTQGEYPHEWHLNIGRHNEAYWSAHVEAYLRWYTAAWREDQAAP
ncbi:MAG: hypothetical protein GXO56_04795 [Chloroflexi bacterium]|nr:hypothetical protein [Chloroflexota bacterium]